MVGERNSSSIFWNAARWIVVGACVLLLLLVAVWYGGGNRFTETFIEKHTQPWAVFQKPNNSAPLEGLDAKLEGGVITVCNRSDTEWSSILVQIDMGYLAAVDRLQPNNCKQLRVHDFATEGWKRMPPPSDLQVTRVAVLATVAQRSYVQKSLLDPRR